MALTISKGKIFVDITSAELLKYFGINMVQILNATNLATQKFTGDWGNSTLYLSDLKGREEEILDAILYEIKEDALEGITDGSTHNNEEQSKADFIDEDLFFKVYADGEFARSFICFNQAKEYAINLLQDDEAWDVSVIDSKGVTHLSTNHSGDD